MKSYYTKCLTWKDVQLTLASNEKAKLVAWPCNQLMNEWVVLVQEECPQEPLKQG